MSLAFEICGSTFFERNEGERGIDRGFILNGRRENEYGRPALEEVVRGETGGDFGGCCEGVWGVFLGV